MAFKVINKLFKGELIQVTPCKGYGYISPAWNKEGLSSKNLYCYYASDSEKQRKQCFLKIFEKGGKYSGHEVTQNYRGEEIWISSNPQIIYFEVEVEGPNQRCIHLFDERHLSQEEKAEAEANSAEEPNFETLLKEQEGATEVNKTMAVEEVPTEEPSTGVEGVAETPTGVSATAKGPSEESGGEEPVVHDAYQEGQDCGKRDYEESHENRLSQYDLRDLSWGDRAEFERGYENGYEFAQDEDLEEKVQNCCFSYEDEEVKQKASKPKKDKEGNSSKASEKEASKNRKAQKKAEEAAFEVAFSDSDC